MLSYILQCTQRAGRQIETLNQETSCMPVGLFRLSLVNHLGARVHLSFGGPETCQNTGDLYW